MKKEWKRQARDEEGREEGEEEERREGEVLLRAEDDEDRGKFNVGKRVGRERTPDDVGGPGKIPPLKKMDEEGRETEGTGRRRKGGGGRGGTARGGGITPCRGR